MDIRRYKPQAIVTFYTEKGELVARTSDNPNSDIDKDVISINTSRDMGADAPTFSINLTRKKPWHLWIASNDLIKIETQRPPEKKKVIFYGIVDDSRKRVAMADNSVERVINITGRGLAKALIVFDIGIVPEAGYASPDVGWLVSNGVTLAGAQTDDVVRDIWELLGSEYINYKWSNNQTLYNLVNLKTKGQGYMMLLDDMNLINWQGSLWALMKEVAEEPFYELFWEIENDRPTLILRPTPFDSQDWYSLPVHIITDEDVIIDDIGRSDIETYTLYSVGAKALYSPDDAYQTLGVLPYWYKPFADKYGIRRLHVESAYTAVAEEQDTQVVNIMQDMQKKLFNWNIKNNQMFNGTIVIKGNDSIHIGDRLLHKSSENGTDIEYYVKSVSHNFINYGSWTTELGVVRGLPSSERFTSPCGEYTEFTGLGIEMVYIGDSYYGNSSIQTPGTTTFPPNIDGNTANNVVNGAYALMNKGTVRYVFGGPGIEYGKADCSQFTQYIYQKYAGINIGRSTGHQVTKGNKVNREDLQPGDLVLFKNTYASPHLYGVSHVGIYIGDGEFIHNSSGAKGLTIGNLNSKYWRNHWLMGRRVLISSSSSEKTICAKATAYGATTLNGGSGIGKTYTGTIPKEGRTIAVDPKMIALNSKVKITCDSYPEINGTYIAEDIGGAIKNNRIDIYFNDLTESPVIARKRMLDFGVRDVIIQIL